MCPETGREEMSISGDDECVNGHRSVLNLTPASKIDDHYDRGAELKAFDDSKAGVKGLVDAAITEIPRIFLRPPDPDGNESNGISRQSSTQLSIPVIDLKDHDKDPEKRKAIVQRVVEASEDWGFFQVINHGIPTTVLEEMINGTRRFFEQDTEVKKQYYSREVDKFVRYISNFDLYKAKFANWRDTLFCSMNLHPPNTQDLPEICRDIITQYSEEVRILGRLLFELLSEGLGLKPNHLIDMDCNECLTVLCHYYPACPQPELTLGGSKHADNGFITVLLQDQIGGLQALHKNKWIDIPPIAGALVINIGDLLQLISNDRLKSIEHRVLANREGPRVSVASFFGVSPLPSFKLYGPIKELLSEQNPAKYRETNLRDYLVYHLGKGLTDPSALHNLRI